MAIVDMRGRSGGAIGGGGEGGGKGGAGLGVREGEMKVVSLDFFFFFLNSGNWADRLE